MKTNRIIKLLGCVTMLLSLGWASARAGDEVINNGDCSCWGVSDITTIGDPGHQTTTCTGCGGLICENAGDPQMTDAMKAIENGVLNGSYVCTDSNNQKWNVSWNGTCQNNWTVIATPITN